ncbi:MAG: hypothetical protein N2C12_01650, partial [Planctomycetales bacterium]
TQLAVAMLVCSGPANAAAESYPYVPRQVRLLESELVILGTVETVETSVIPEQRIPQTIAKISVERTLKGEEAGETATISFPSDSLELSAAQPDQDKQGTRGVWILSGGEGSGNYQVRAADAFVAESEIHAVEEDLRILDDLVWSQPFNGLKFASIVEVNDVGGREVWIDGRLVPAQATVAVFPVVKNTTKSDMKLCNFSADHPFVATWSREGSQDWQPHLYSVPKVITLKPEIMHFQQIAPSEVQSVGHGFVLPPLLNEGSYTLKIRFATDRTETDSKTGDDAGRAERADAWTGAVDLPKYELTLPIQE